MIGRPRDQLACVSVQTLGREATQATTPNLARSATMAIQVRRPALLRNHPAPVRSPAPAADTSPPYERTVRAISASHMPGRVAVGAGAGPACSPGRYRPARPHRSMKGGIQYPHGFGSNSRAPQPTRDEGQGTPSPSGCARKCESTVRRFQLLLQYLLGRVVARIDRWCSAVEGWIGETEDKLSAGRP